MNTRLMVSRRLRSLFALLLQAVLLLGVARPSLAAEKPQVILLKLDDLSAYGTDVKAPVSPRWQRVTNYLLTNGIKASFGIICSSLEGNNAAYFDWIKNLQRGGRIEFWLHGYRNRTAQEPTGEFETGTFEEQKAVLEKSEKLAKEKLGFSLSAFGPHWSETTEATDQALEAVPEIKIWLHAPKQPKYFTRLGLERVMTLEDPIFVPDSAKFREFYEANAATREVLVLQGHPNQWDGERWEGFVKIVEFLRAKGCVFETPSGYLASLPAKHGR